MRADPTLLRPTADPAPRALLCVDPAGALALAQHLLDGPLMFNHARGLWGYAGPARRDGERLLVQSTGTGGPSAALVLADLRAAGVERAVHLARVFDPPQAPAGVRSVAGRDGTSRALGGPAAPATWLGGEAELTSADVPGPGLVDLESAALLSVGVPLAVLVVAGPPDDEAALLAAGDLAVTAL